MDHPRERGFDHILIAASSCGFRQNDAATIGFERSDAA
jgi:hypothetical protein